MRRRTMLAAAAAVGSALCAAAPLMAQQPAAAVPAEIDGQINGKKAHFVSAGDDVLLSVSEAERLELRYLDGKTMSIGGTPLWLVTLESVTANGRTRLLAPAGVVPSIAGYLAAVRSHPAEAFARSREVAAEINGVSVKAYDLGVSGVLLTPAEAERSGLKFREGKQQSVGRIGIWVIEAPVRIGAEKQTATMVTVAEPEAYFEALMTGATPK